MRSKGLSIALGLALFFGLGVFLASQEVADAQECRIVRIYSGIDDDANKIRLEPDTILIERKTCVIWSNWATDKLVSIRFSEGKQCESNTTAPTLFKLDATNCYLSSYIEYGGTTSLTFKEVGTYEYVADAKGMESVKGKVEVR